MPDEDLDFFQRQRRNLMLVSAFSIFLKAAELELTNSSILGNTAKINNAVSIPYILLIVLIYLSWRYYIACNEISVISKFKEQFNAYTASLIRNKAIKDAESISGLKYREDFNLVGDSGFNKNRFGEPTSNRSKIKITSYSADIDLEKRKKMEQHGPLIYKDLELKYIEFKALFYTCINNHSFSEYILPYLIAVFAGLEILNFGFVNNAITFLDSKLQLD